eukprot:TRINITY_DN2436_c0_g1_i1.p1 TRINITY_DN2436_c0_g1~~TRINITY_DN2436_c0_g1_i1.p1  ORF type:complete len:415 (-),score=104.46 TRINITY_DN2436_c0_g1_i1:47-1153(-)
MLRALSAASLSRALAGRAGVVAAVTPSSSNASFSSAAPTYDYRRLKRRSAWFEPDPEDIEKFVFPRVGHGKDWQLNWSLNAVRVTPQNLAYRNLHLAGLHMFSSSPKDAQGRVIIPAGAAKHQSYVVESDEGAASASTGGFSALSQAEGRMVARNVRQHLSSIDRLFVHDGAVGSGEALVLNRAITDSPALAIALSHVMQRARLGSPADFGHEFVTLLAEGASAADIGLGKVSGSFSVFDPQERVLVVGGRPSVGAVVEAQADAANYLLATTPDAAFPLARSHVLATPSGRSVLFGHPEAIVCNELVSAHNAAWGKQGVYRSFGGVVASNTPKNYKYKRGDVVEESGSKYVCALYIFEQNLNYILKCY